MNNKPLADISPKDLLPHRGTMLLVENIHEITKTFAIASATVTPHWPLADNNGVGPVVLIELAAQTAGICNSWNDLDVTHSTTGNRGWLVGIKTADFHIETIPVGSNLVIRAENMHKYDMLREIKSIITLDNRVIGKITLQLIKAEKND